jgi:hypothetical protein
VNFPDFRFIHKACPLLKLQLIFIVTAKTQQHTFLCSKNSNNFGMIFVDSNKGSIRFFGRGKVTTQSKTVDPTRKTSLVAGILYLVTFISSIPAVMLLAPVLNNPNYIISAGADFQVICGISLDLVNALAAIGTAVALFWVVKRQNESFALGFVTTRLVEGTTVIIGVVCILALVTLRQTVGFGTNSAALVAVGQGLVAVRNWTFTIGPSLMPALNAFLLGTLMYRSRLVPRLIPAAGLIGFPLQLSAAILTIFGVNNTIFQGIAVAPIFFWELAVGLWMSIKGFNQSAPLIMKLKEEKKDLNPVPNFSEFS